MLATGVKPTSRWARAHRCLSFLSLPPRTGSNARQRGNKGCPRGRIPKDLGLRERMERKLLAKRGRALYKKRGILVEPVFGQVKEGQGFRRFMRRGISGCLKRGGDHRNNP